MSCQCFLCDNDSGPSRVPGALKHPMPMGQYMSVWAEWVTHVEHGRFFERVTNRMTANSPLAISALFNMAKERDMFAEEAR